MSGPIWRSTWGTKKTEMAFDPREYLTTANALLNQARTEAEYRTIAGRAYYAVYGIIRREVCDAAGYNPFGNDGKHGQLLDRMTRIGNSPLKRAAPHLKHLRDLRVRSDYTYLESSVSRADADKAVKVADAVFDDLGDMQDHDYDLQELAARLR